MGFILLCTVLSNSFVERLDVPCAELFLHQEIIWVRQGSTAVWRRAGLWFLPAGAWAAPCPRDELGGLGLRARL